MAKSTVVPRLQMSLTRPEDLARHVLVEVAGRLVGQQEARRLHDGARQRGPLGLALGELVADTPGRARRGPPPSAPRRARGDLAPRRAEHAQHEGHVLEHGAAGEQLGVLEDDADRAAQARDLGASELGDVEAGHLDVALGGDVGAIEHAEQRGLAGPAGAR